MSDYPFNSFQKSVDSMPLVGHLQTVVEAFTEVGKRSQVKIVIGGACTTPRMAEEVGCGAYGLDAVAAARICEGLLAI
ncbi:MAG: hypothetical protein SWK90_17490 [Chloroflexota bacterium]|nr:hypothetical protein [Chloroflexota bacterium]